MGPEPSKPERLMHLKTETDRPHNPLYRAVNPQTRGGKNAVPKLPEYVRIIKNLSQRSSIIQDLFEALFNMVDDVRMSLEQI